MPDIRIRSVSSGTFGDDDPISQVAPHHSSAIAQMESGGRYDLVGPSSRTGDRPYGKYQVMGENVGPWTKEALGAELTPSQFLSDKDAQEAVFNHKFGSYVQKYGPEGAARAWFAGERGMTNDNARDSLGTSVQRYAQNFNAISKRHATASDQSFGLDDPIEGGNTAAAPQAPSPLPSRAGPEPLPTKPTTNFGQRLLTDFENTQSAGGQMTTPNVGAHTKNLLSSKVFVDDTGDLNFEDPATGKLAPVDRNKHVVLRDPNDNELKIYNRTPETDEGRLSALGHIALPAIATNTPTRLPGVLNNALSRAGEAIGVNVPRVSVAGPVTQWLGSILSRIPVVGSPLRKASEQATEQLSSAVNKVRGGYGSGNIANAGEAEREAIEKYIGITTKDRASRLYDKVDSFVDPATKIVPRKTVEKIIDLVKEAETAGRPVNKDVTDMINVLRATDGQLSYQGVKLNRTAIIDKLGTFKVSPGDSNAGILKQLKNALNEDLRTAAATGGPKATAAFERANNYYRLVSDRRDNLARLLKPDGDEGVIGKLINAASSGKSGDINLLRQARKATDAETWNEAASSVIEQMGRAAGTAEDFSPAKFVTQWDKLSAEGKGLLFRSTGKGELATSLDNIATVSRAFKQQIARYGNPSGTGQHVWAATAASAGAWAEPLSTLSTIVGANMTARFLAKTESAKAIGLWSKAYQNYVMKPTVVTENAIRNASRIMASGLARELERPEISGLLLREFNGAIPVRADEQQQ